MGKDASSPRPVDALEILFCFLNSDHSIVPRNKAEGGKVKYGYSLNTTLGERDIIITETFFFFNGTRV
jgi:hypothetical protein